jgi:hypothetical protein
MTGPDGGWQFKTLPPKYRDFSITVSHPEFIDSRFITDGPGRGFQNMSLARLLGSNAVIQLRQGVSVTGRVLDEAGQPIVGAKLLLGNSRFTIITNLTTTDERGEFLLRTTNTTATYLTVQAKSYAPEIRQITVDANTALVEFKLAPGHTFKAKVVDEFGTPIRDVRVTVDMWQNRQTVDLGGTTDSRGKITIHSMPATDMSGSIFKSGYVRTSGLQFPVDGEEVTLTLRKSPTVP